MSEDIQIEQHSFSNDGDENDLFEITHLTFEDLEELNSLISLSSISASDKIRRFQRALKKSTSMLDRSIAS